MAPKRFYPTLLLTFLLAGTLDAIAAMAINPNVSPDRIFRFIASGVFGKTAFTAGTHMISLGIIFHYLIAYIFTAIGFILFPRLKRLLRNKLAVALVYGACVWLIMNFIVVPLSNTPKSNAPMTAYGVTTGIATLMLCIGLPIALMAGKYYRPVKAYVPVTA